MFLQSTQAISPPRGVFSNIGWGWVLNEVLSHAFGENHRFEEAV